MASRDPTMPGVALQQARGRELRGRALRGRALRGRAAPGRAARGRAAHGRADPGPVRRGQTKTATVASERAGAVRADGRLEVRARPASPADRSRNLAHPGRADLDPADLGSGPVDPGRAALTLGGRARYGTRMRRVLVSVTGLNPIGQARPGRRAAVAPWPARESRPGSARLAPGEARRRGGPGTGETGRESPRDLTVRPVP
jgi:hypothetical protein